MRDGTDDGDALDARIAALEAKIAALEGAREARPRAGAKDWLERDALLGVWAGVILVLGVLRPDQMFAWNSYATMLGSNAMVVVLTLALIVPLTTGDFDLSVAATMGLSSMLIAVLDVTLGYPILGAILVALLAGALVGAVNAFFILYFRVFSLIVTLGTGYFVAGLVLWLSGGTTVAGVSMDLVRAVILTRFLGVPLGFWYAALLTLAVWWLFQHTALGRRMLFVGRGREVARLSGVAVDRVRAGALVASSVMAAFAGVLYTGMRGVADPSSALAFLLPAFAAAYLGSTAIYPGRFNAPGAFVAVYLLSTGVMGLNFLGVSSFVQNLFYGGGLVLAVAASQLVRGRKEMA
jgi:ribose transport system permease protein